MGFKISPLLQEHMCRIGAKLPFEEASEELTLLLGIDVNAKQIERLCHRYGEQIDQVDWQLSHQDGVQLKIPEAGTGPVYCMADGSMLLTREENWKEIKLGRIFTGGQHITGISKDRGMISQSSYCAHFGNSDDFWERFTKEIPSSSKELVFICDGAKWLWNNIDDCYPDSIQILDFYHCKEHICEFAKAYFKGRAKQQQAFIDSIINQLTSKKVDGALGQIAALGSGNKDKQLKKDKLLGYLTNNKKRIDYGSFTEKGLLIGSGPIEAANRNVIQKRLKLSGQRWTIKGAQQVANLRTTLKSNRWDRIVSLITDHKIAA